MLGGLGRGYRKLCGRSAGLDLHRVARNGGLRPAGPVTQGGLGTTTARSFGGGTFGYTAPDVASGRFSHKADIFSLGVIFYNMVSGGRPDLSDPEPSSPIADPLQRQLVSATLVRLARDRPAAQELVHKIAEWEETALANRFRAL